MKNFITSLGLAAALTFTPIAVAQKADTPYTELPAGAYELDPTHASLTWKVSHLGLSNYTARFTKFDATIDLNQEDPTKSSVSVTIDPTSIETDFVPTEKKDFNDVLINKKKWFNAGKYPEITFNSTALDINDDNTGTLTGDLTFLGVTKPVSLNVTLNGAYKKAPFSKKAAMGFSATGTITRSDFGFKTYAPAIGDDVDLLIEVEFYKADDKAE